MSDVVLTEVTDGVGIIALNRPDKFNCLSRELVRALGEAVAALTANPDVRVLLIRAEGKVFCTGADLAQILETRKDEAALGALLTDLLHTLRQLERGELPVVVAVHGMALAGGLELVMACDVVFAGRSARLGDQHAQYGLVPGGGNSQRLVRVLGRRRALELMLSARWLTADEAREFGLVNYVTDDDSLLAEALDYCRSMAQRSASGLAMMKRMADEGIEMSMDDGLALEVALAVEGLRGADADEGLAAFAERRPPRFAARRTG